MTRTAHAAPEIDLVVDSTLWNAAPGAEPSLRRAVAEAAAAAALSTKRAELAIGLTDDSAIRLLNRDWRGVDAATNVLSFPASSHSLARGRRAAPRLLGDIVLAYETIAREARDEHKTFTDHLAHLAVHGFLHLLGYDHDRDDAADRMEKLERDILARLSIPDPYRRVAEA